MFYFVEKMDNFCYGLVYLVVDHKKTLIEKFVVVHFDFLILIDFD